MLVRVQAVDVTGEPRTYTVVQGGLPVGPVEEWLEHLRVQGCSPNTVRSYAKAAAELWIFLELARVDWQQVDLKVFQRFPGYLRTGQLPSSAVPVDAAASPRQRSLATVNARYAGVLSFYRYHRHANGVEVHARLHRAGARRAPRQEPLLAHLHDGAGEVPLLRVRHEAQRPQPLLTPEQVEAILSAIGQGVQLGDPVRLRDRLLFEVLAETGCRLAEALCLQHRDWHVGGGQTPYLDICPREHPRGLRVKGGRWRRIHVSDRLARLYSEYVWQLVDAGADDVLDLNQWWVFVNWARGERFAPMSPSTVYDRVRALRRQLRGQVPHTWTPHWFRHTHATALLLGDVPEHIVMRRLGHAHVQTTRQLYGWVTEEAAMRVVAGWRDSPMTERWRLHDVHDR